VTEDQSRPGKRIPIPDVVSVTKDLKNRLKQASETLAGIASDAAQMAGSAVELAKETYNTSGAKDKVEDISNATKHVLEATHVVEAAEAISKTAGDHLDTISGARLLALVEERLAIQSKYNDILATKVNEALKRIQRLQETAKLQSQ